MWEIIPVVLIVGAAAAGVAYSFFRSVSDESGCGGCRGCGRALDQERAERRAGERSAEER